MTDNSEYISSYSNLVSLLKSDTFRSVNSKVTSKTPLEKAVNLSPNDRQLATDPFATFEQTKRDSSISDLLCAYTEAYKKKQGKNRIYRDFLFYSCLTIVVLISISLLVITIVFLCRMPSSISDLVTLITILATFSGSIIGILKVITEYVFPQGDEKYITTIVKAVQQNDLDNKRELIKYNNGHGPTNNQDH